MANICTLRDINSKGHRLGSIREVELEEALRDSCKSNSELIDDFKNYQKVYKKYIKNIKQDKLESAQKDAFSTQKEIIKKESEIISLKSELTNIKNELTNTKDELASKINEIECLGTLYPASQKTKDILDPVVMGGAEKNTQSEEQSFKSNSEAESKSLVKYFKSKKKMEAEINDTSLTNQESLTNDISNIKNELILQ
ncbi:9707_t:CDS:2 [Dentiscutata erythropus]|uniref:9707_t:CDS:1 n=1 Tax=Dentiscutata erythropus TaxID=1348616 RepID=A0A9N9JGZ0_9GLOM|nr:9707_t:CDS:2 [Dentiscutata erythropus]